MYIMVAAACAVILGLAYGEPIPILKDIGDLFISLLKMVVVPVAFVSITGSVIKLGGSAGKLTARAVALMVFMSAIGVILGLALTMNTHSPVVPIETAPIEAKAPTAMEFIMGCVPVNPFRSLADGNMLQIVVLSLLIGAASLRMEKRDGLAHGFEVAGELCMKVTGLVLKIAPVGVFALLYPLAASDFQSLASFYLAMAALLLVGIALYMFGVCVPLLQIAGVRGFMKTVIWNDVIGAISGGATNYMAPRIRALKEKTDIPHDAIDFLIPLTSVLMRAGSCICVGLYTAAAAAFFGVDLTPGTIAITVSLSIVALTCAPGIIGGTLMDCAIVWSAIGIPLEAVVLFAGIDYLMDIIRTVLNIQGGEVVTACVGKEE